MLNRRFIIPAAAAVVALAFVACQDGGLAPDEVDAPQFKKASPNSQAAAVISAMMDDMNATLAVQGADYRATMGEYFGDGEQMGATILQKDVGNKQLGFDFVPFDARRAPWSGPVGGPADNIVYAVDTFFPQASNLPLATTEAAIDRAMGTWEARQCSNLPVNKVPLPPGVDVGIAAGGFLVGDINHGGWLPLPPGVLGVAITFAFCAPCGPPPPVFTDIDGNGKGDTAFRDIFYSSSFTWADDGVTDFDVETVALHEAGHGLSQAHFGNIFLKKGNFVASPKAVMNAFYQGPRRTLLGTDNGGHCSNWAQWPNN